MNAISIIIALVVAARLVSSYSSSSKDEKESPGNPFSADEQFVGLQHRSSHTKKLHLISELAHHGHILQVEEFLDWSTDGWRQYIRMKPAPSKYVGTNTADRLAESRPSNDDAYNFLIINSERQNLLYRYLPYQCTMQKLWNIHSDRPNDPKASWREVNEYLNKDSEDFVTKLIDSMMSPNLIGSPYHATETLAPKTVNHVFGVSALWLKASHSTPLGQTVNVLNGKRSKELSWQFKMMSDSRLILKYYFESALLEGMERNNTGRLSNTEYDSLVRVEVISNDTVTQSINIVASDFDFSPELAHNLFMLPVGFGCPENESHERQVNFFTEPNEFNSLSEIEIVSKVFESSGKVNIDTKTLIMAQARHPFYMRRHVSLMHVIEDGNKVIKDFGSMLRYTMVSGARADCFIAKVIFDEHAKTLIETWMSVFNKQQVFLELADSRLHQLFYRDDSEQNFLNRIEISQFEDELVFEQELKPDQLDIVRFRSAPGHYLERRVTIVRVYSQHIPTGKRNVGFIFRSHLRLVRVSLLVFDSDKRVKLAEVRFNIFNVERLDFVRKAHLFDTSPCFDIPNESIDVVATYPLEPRLVDHFTRHSHELIEGFYSIARPVIDERDKVSERQRLLGTLNYLRVPKVSVQRSAAGDHIEVHFRILERLYPLHTFLRYGEHSFVSLDDDESVIVRSAKECAQRCQLIGCEIFAFSPYDLACKLSRHVLTPDGNMYLTTTNASVDAYRLKRQKAGSVLYAKDPHQLDLGPSLAEFYAYLEREMTSGLNNEEDEGMRSKRSTKVRPPILSIAIVDRDEEERIISKRSLIPSEVHAMGAPLYVDFDDNPSTFGIANLFATQERYKHFAWNSNPDKERTYRYKSGANTTYYTMKPVRSISIDRCQLLCYNINEWNALDSTGQVCTSYSYCHEDKPAQCVLDIITDSGFDDRVHFDEDINSLGSLLVEKQDCFMARRRHLAEFNDPIRLSLNGSFKKSNSPLRYKWLTVTNETIDLGKFDEPVLRDNCAKECSARSSPTELCKSLDFCTAPSEEVTSKQQLARVECHLFTLNLSEQVISNASELIKQTTDLRHSLQNNSIGNPSQLVDHSNDRSSGLRCDRYLSLQSRDYNHIVPSQIRPNVLQSQLGRQKMDLRLSSVDSIATSRDRCVSECSIRGLNDCLGFEYCYHTPSNGNDNGRAMNIACTLLFPLDKNGLDQRRGDEPNGEYSKECHLYLKSPFRSLGDVVRFGNDQEFEFTTLVIVFVIVFMILTILMALVLKKVLGVQFSNVFRCVIDFCSKPCANRPENAERLS